MKNTTVAWVIMMLATILSYGFAGLAIAARIEILAVVLIGALKAALIVHYFMELKKEAHPYNVTFGTWIVLSTLIIVGGSWGLVQL